MEDQQKKLSENISEKALLIQKLATQLEELKKQLEEENKIYGSVTAEEIEDRLKGKMQNKLKLEAALAQAVETLNVLNAQSESLRSAIETLKSQIGSMQETSEGEIQEKITVLSEEKKEWNEKYSRQYADLENNRCIYNNVQKNQGKWQQQSRNMCGCGHFLIQQGELSAESARSSWKPMYRWLILTGSCAGLICGL